jgi:hypothetical protein
MKEINDIGVRALVDALGAEDARRFLGQFASSRSAAARADETSDADLPSLDVEESHETIRDMQDPMQQQHLL